MANGILILWDIQSGKKIGGLKIIAQNGLRGIFSPIRPLLATGGPNDMLLLWDSEVGTRTGPTFKGHRYAMQTCAFSPDGGRMAAGDASEYNVTIRDVATGNETFHIPGRTDRTDVASYTVSFSPDGTRLYSGNQDGKIKVWDAGWLH